MFRRSFALIAVGGLAACTSLADNTKSSGAAASVSTGLPCAVNQVLQDSCQGCHSASPQFGAPMPLMTYADLMAPSHSDPSKKVYELVAARTHATSHPMPPPPNDPLSPAALSALDSWAAAATPASTELCNNGPDQPTPGLSCTPNLHIQPASAWAMPETTDNVYVCYGFDVTPAQRQQIVAMKTKVDNANILHHALIFETPTAVSGTPTPCNPSTPANWRIVYGWAPGGKAIEMPPEAGYPQTGTTHYVVQLHYNNVLHRPNQFDASGFDFCTTTDLRPNDADTMAFGATNFSIPPRSHYDMTCDTRLPSSAPDDIHVIAALPHMHNLGTSISTTDVTTGADLGTRSSWDFQNQSFVLVDKVIHKGDTFRTRCAWTNNTDAAVNYGPWTEDEMCFSFSIYWPRITAPNWSLWAPVAAAQCHPTE